MNHHISVAGLLLAAGQSKRFGRHKLLEPLAGDVLICKTVRSWLQSKITRLYVVTGHQQQDVKKALAGLNLDLIENQHFETGIASSIAAGVRETESKYSHILIGLADMPHVKPRTIDTLVEAAARAPQDKRLWVPNFAGQQGNPVLWHSLAAPALISLDGDQGGRQVFPTHKSVMEDVAVDDPGILQDIDTPEDLNLQTKKKADQ